jgi:hypothetical protein
MRFPAGEPAIFPDSRTSSGFLASHLGCGVADSVGPERATPSTAASLATVIPGGSRGWNAWGLLAAILHPPCCRAG